MDEAWGDDFGDEEGEVIACPECGVDVYDDVESCPECGYWITDADRNAAWQAGSATGRIKAIGLWALGITAALALWRWLQG